MKGSLFILANLIMFSFFIVPVKGWSYAPSIDLNDPIVNFVQAGSKRQGRYPKEEPVCSIWLLPQAIYANSDNAQMTLQGVLLP
jgi:hypothetical protein